MSVKKQTASRKLDKVSSPNITERSGHGGDVKAAVEEMKRGIVVKTELPPTISPPEIVATCLELQRLGRRRAVYIKTRNMQMNNLRAVIANTLGYTAFLEESNRQEKMKEADKVIKEIVEGKRKHDLEEFTLVSHNAISALDDMRDKIDKGMTALAKGLPIARWVEMPEQRGLSLSYLAVILGETGDIGNYSCPGRVWKRMGLLAWRKGDKVGACSTWKSGKLKGLSTEEWETMGYSPRRRSIAYILGEGLIKQNFVGGKCDSNVGSNESLINSTSADEDRFGESDDALGNNDGCRNSSHRTKTTKGKGDKGCSGAKTTTAQPGSPGPYRLRYLQAKAKAHASHPEWDWKPCDNKPRCKGEGCKCGGTGFKCKHAHLHGMLLASKMLLRNLWRYWHGQPQVQEGD